MAARAFFIVTAGMMIVLRQRCAVVAARWISDKYAVVILSRRWWFIGELLLATIRYWFQVTVDSCDWHLHATVCGVHFLVTVFADGHYVPQGLKPGNVCGGYGTAEAVPLRVVCFFELIAPQGFEPRSREAKSSMLVSVFIL